MPLNHVLKYYLLTVFTAIAIPIWMTGSLEYTFLLLAIIALANLPQWLLLIKTAMKIKMILAPIATIIPAAALCYIIYDDKNYMPDYVAKILASLINCATNLFLLVFVYEKIKKDSIQ